MKEDQTTESKRSRIKTYAKLQRKRRRFFYRHKKHQRKQKPSLPGWPINIDSIRLCKKKASQQQQQQQQTANEDHHADRVLDISLEKLHNSLETLTSPQYTSTLNNAVDNATHVIRAVMKEIGKNDPPSPSPESSHLGYEDVLLAALGAHVPPLVIRRALERMKTIIPLKDQATEQIIQRASNPPDIFGATGKSLASMESIYGFFSPVEGELSASLLPVEDALYKYEPTYMNTLRPSISSGGMYAGTTVEHIFLNMTAVGTLPSGPH